MGEPTESSPACAGTQTSAVAAAAASPAPAAIMAAPPSTTARSAVPSSASLRLRDEQLAPPSLTKRPKTTPATTCYVFGEASPMLPWGVGSGTRAPVISPFTNFAASLTPLYPSAVQAALPTPLAQLMHAAASERREANDDSTLLKPKRSVTFSREQSAGGAELSSALGELGELASGSFTLRQHEQQQPQPFLADRLRADGFDRRLSGVHDGGQAAGGQATHTPFAEPSLADWARVGDPPDSIARVLSMQPTQRGLSPLSAELGGDADGAKNKQAVHKRRLQFECDQVAMEQLHGGSAALASTPLRTPVRETDEPWLLMNGSILGTPIACCSPSLPMLGTPNSLKEAFRLSEGEQGLSLCGKGRGASLAGGSGTSPSVGLPGPLGLAGGGPSSAGAPGAAKAKRDRSGGGKENAGKSKPRTCNCKNSKCIKLYCDCFSAGEFCLPTCKCDKCLNNEENEAARDEARRSILERNHHAFTSKVTMAQQEGSHMKGCNCKNSRCMKKYCECYQAGIQCTEKCKCANCSNGKPGQADGTDDASAAGAPIGTNELAAAAGGRAPVAELMLKLSAAAGAKGCAAAAKGSTAATAAPAAAAPAAAPATPVLASPSAIPLVAASLAPATDAAPASTPSTRLDAQLPLLSAALSSALSPGLTSGGHGGLLIPPLLPSVAAASEPGALQGIDSKMASTAKHAAAHIDTALPSAEQQLQLASDTPAGAVSGGTRRTASDALLAAPSATKAAQYASVGVVRRSSAAPASDGANNSAQTAAGGASGRAATAVA